MSSFSFSPSDSDLVQVRTHRMLSRNQSQRYKVKLGLRTWLALAVGVWMIYQLRVFLNHKQSSESENGLSVKEKNQPDKLKLGRKGLVLMGSESREHNEEEEKLEDKEEVEEQSGDVDEEELDTVRFDDPMDEIDSLDDDDDDDSASTDQHGDEEDDSPNTESRYQNSLNSKVDTNKNDSLQNFRLKRKLNSSLG